ncbi:phosphotransferase [Pseudanabaena sp. PCC 6802]|uniref:phosphotransferase n=1 Tax=Pseudanabaena sp. PCC 6802 TaxID=118173 RepID=UPI00036035CF
MSSQEDRFPTVYSTLACDALMSRVLPHYKIARVTGCQLWNRGLSDIYIVETVAQPYILRISHCHWRSKSDVYFEMELLDFLRQRQLPVAYPLRTKENRLSIEINAPEGRRYASLFTYAPGKVALGDLNQAQSFKLGEVVASIHQAGVDFHSSYYRQPLTLSYLLDDSLEAIAPFLRHRDEDLQFLLEVVTLIKHRLQDFPQEPPFWGICWGDPHSGNAHFTSDNQVTLFDFDQCGYGWRAFELGKFLQVAIRTGIAHNVREAFLRGYQSVQPISKRELDSLQTFTQMAHIWMWAINLSTAKIHSYNRLDESYFTHRLSQLKMLRSHEWQLF